MAMYCMVARQIEGHLAGIPEELVFPASGWGRLKAMTGLVLECTRKPGEPAEGTLICRKEPRERAGVSKLPHLASSQEATRSSVLQVTLTHDPKAST